MGLFSVFYDDTAKARKLIAYPGFTDLEETVSGSDKSDFTLAVALTASHAVDIWVDGRMQMSGSFTKTVANPGHIVMGEAVVVGKVFKARVYTI